MKFIADMGISPKVIHLLQSLGYQAVHLQIQGLHRLKDIEILEKARKEGSIILTHDLDFGDLLTASNFDLPSVVIFRLRNMRPDNVNKYLEKIITEYAELLQKGAIITVSEGRLSMASLNDGWIGDLDQGK